MLAEIHQKFLVGHTGTEQDAVHPSVNQPQKLLGLLLGIVIGVGNNDAVTAAVHIVRHAAHDFWIEKVADIRNYQSNRATFGGGNTSGQRIGTVVQFPDGFEDFFSGLRTHALGHIIDNTGNRGFGHAADLGDLSNGIVFLFCHDSILRRLERIR